MAYGGHGITPGIPPVVDALGRPAGFWIRFAAYIIDYIIVVVASFILSFIIGAGFAGSIVVIAASIAYYLVPTAHWGTTPGKKLLNIYVVNEQGQRNIGYLRAFGRLLGKVVSALILFIGYIMAGVREDKRALHDLIAGTYPTVIIKR